MKMHLSAGARGAGSAWLAAAVLTFSSGCRMCCPSYDYCSPTNNGGDNSICCDHARRGSVLSGGGGTYYDGETIMQDGEPLVPPAVPSPPTQPAPLPPAPMIQPNPQTGNPMTYQTTSRSGNTLSARRGR